MINLTAGSHIDLMTTNIELRMTSTRPAAAAAADVFFTFTLTQRELVYADTFNGATWTRSSPSPAPAPRHHHGHQPGDVLCDDDAAARAARWAGCNPR